jgi:hypothetical protein
LVIILSLLLTDGKSMMNKIEKGKLCDNENNPERDKIDGCKK